MTDTPEAIPATLLHRLPSLDAHGCHGPCNQGRAQCPCPSACEIASECHAEIEFIDDMKEAGIFILKFLAFALMALFCASVIALMAAP